jgi:TPR repeat protein
MQLRRLTRSLLLLALLAPAAAMAAAGETKAPSRIYEIPPQLLTAGFLDAHPDMGYRIAGIRRDKAHEYEAAFRQYRHAASFGDKPSQARLGEMYWNGEGVATDRVMGFLWMALAAERGQREFSLLKLFYWQHLDAAEQDRARAQEQAMLAENGDKAAEHRLGVVMRREQHKTTGSYLGYNAAAGPLFMSNGLDPELYYAQAYWDPDQYLKLRDRIFEQHYEGRVEVGELEQLPDDPVPAPAATP